MDVSARGLSLKRVACQSEGTLAVKAVGHTAGAEAEVGLGTAHPKEGNGPIQDAGSERGLAPNPQRFPWKTGP